MRLIDSGIRAYVLSQGKATRWMRTALHGLAVQVRLTDHCVEDLVRDADRHARAALRHDPSGAYLTLLHEAIAVRARWIKLWTASDETFPEQDESGQAFVRIARLHALPRPWKLSEPVAVPARRPVPSYWNWASADAA